MKDALYYATLVTLCSAIAYWMLRDVLRPPNHRVTKKMLEQAELDAIFGDGVYEADVDEDDEEEV